MTDRLPNSPGKYSAVVAGEELQKMQTGRPFAIHLQLDDDPVREGTPYSKAAVLPDSLAEKICPGIEDPMPKDAFLGLWEKKADGICHKTGATIMLNDSAHTPLKGLKLFGKTVQNGVPSPESPAALETVGASGNIVVTVSGDQGNQTLKASTPNGLPGIPVSSGGNYTDENGQQWICDEIDFARGVYIKRIEKVVYTGSENIFWNKSGSYQGSFWYSLTANYPSHGEPMSKDNQTIRCSHALFVPDFTSYTMGKCTTDTTLTVSFWLGNSTAFPDIAAWKTYLARQYTDGNPVTVQYIRQTPKLIDLSTEELETYAKLHTYEPNTTVLNDGGAGMEIAYYTPTTAVQMVHSLTDAGKVLSIDERGCVALTKQEDRVVEQGVSNNWTYRKWSSGVAECWLTHVDTANIGGSVVWDKFYQSHTSDIPLPVVFTETPAFHVSVSGGAPAIYSGTTYVSKTNIIQLSSYVRTEDTSKSYNITYCVHAIGKWK